MSAIFVFDCRDDQQNDETWDSGGGLHHWVIEFLADRVSDREAEKELRDYLAGGYRFFALSVLSSPRAVEQVSLLLRDHLVEVAAADGELTDAGRELVEALVAMAGRWCAARNL